VGLVRARPKAVSSILVPRKGYGARAVYLFCRRAHLKKMILLPHQMRFISSIPHSNPNADIFLLYDSRAARSKGGFARNIRDKLTCAGFESRRSRLPPVVPLQPRCKVPTSP